jgi:hypothetical protein
MPQKDLDHAFAELYGQQQCYICRTTHTRLSQSNLWGFHKVISNSGINNYRSIIFLRHYVIVPICQKCYNQDKKLKLKNGLIVFLPLVSWIILCLLFNWDFQSNMWIYLTLIPIFAFIIVFGLKGSKQLLTNLNLEYPEIKKLRQEGWKLGSTPGGEPENSGENRFNRIVDAYIRVAAAQQ